MAKTFTKSRFQRSYNIKLSLLDETFSDHSDGRHGGKFTGRIQLPLTTVNIYMGLYKTRKYLKNQWELK